MLYEWLKDYQKLEEEIDYLEFELRRYKKELGRWMYGDLQDIKLTVDSDGSKLENIISNVEYEIAHKMNDLYDAKKLIGKFKGLDNQILYKKYVEGKHLTEVAIELQYSYNYIKSKHAEVMRMIKFADKLKVR